MNMNKINKNLQIETVAYGEDCLRIKAIYKNTISKILILHYDPESIDMTNHIVVEDDVKKILFRDLKHVYILFRIFGKYIVKQVFDRLYNDNSEEFYVIE